MKHTAIHHGASPNLNEDLASVLRSIVYAQKQETDRDKVSEYIMATDRLKALHSALWRSSCGRFENEAGIQEIRDAALDALIEIGNAAMDFPDDTEGLIELRAGVLQQILNEASACLETSLARSLCRSILNRNGRGSGGADEAVRTDRVIGPGFL
ncbi:MAG: hypothetical protein ACK5JT_13685 [Hyphomicrobiaceae bacterium]